MKRLITTSIGLLIALSVFAFPVPFSFWKNQNSGSVLTWLQVVTNIPSAANVWVTDTPTGPVHDYKGSDNLTAAGSFTFAQTGLFTNQANDAALAGAGVKLTCTSTNTANFQVTSNFTISFILKPNCVRSGTANYILYAKPNAAGTIFGNIIYLQWNDSSSLANAMNLTSFRYDGSVTYKTSAQIDITNNVPVVLDVVFYYTNSTPYVLVYQNANRCQMIDITRSGVPSSQLSTFAATFCAYNDASSNYQGVVQAMAVYNANLTAGQILTNYLAYAGVNPDPSTTLYSSVADIDLPDGQPDFASMQPLWIGASNYDAVVFNAVTNANYQITSGNNPSLAGDWDQHGTNLYVAFSSSLLPGTFSNITKVFDGASAPNCNFGSVTRPHLLWNANTSLYMLYGHINTNFYKVGSSFLLIAESANVGGPYTIVSTTFVPPRGEVNDENVMSADNGTNYMVCDTPGVGIVVYALTSDGHNVVGTGTIVDNSGAVEAPILMQNQGAFQLLMTNPHQFYDASKTVDVFGKCCTNSHPLDASKYTASFSVYRPGENPFGSGLAAQTAAYWTDHINTNNVYVTLDGWENAFLERSTLVVGQMVFSSSTNFYLDMSKAKKLK